MLKNFYRYEITWLNGEGERVCYITHSHYHKDSKFLRNWPGNVVCRECLRNTKIVRDVSPEVKDMYE